MKLKNLLLIFFICSLTTASFAIENSIIPEIESIENLNDFDLNKYTTNQANEIKGVLEQLDQRIRIVSYNLLFDRYDHNLEEEYRWPNRLSRVVEMFNEMNADVVGVQELFPSQLDDLMQHLAEKYKFIGKPCKNGEINGIFFKKDRFTVLDTRIWYLSKDNAASSTLTMLKLKDKVNNKAFAVFNTHLAFSNIEKREMQARLMRKHITNFIAEESCPSILTGDLNTFPNRSDLKRLPFYDGDYIQNIIKGDHFIDAMDAAVLGHLGPLSTFTNEESGTTPFKGTGTPGVFLDHVYVTKDVTVLLHAINPGQVNGRFPSDHMPVIADIMLTTKNHQFMKEEFHSVY